MVTPATDLTHQSIGETTMTILAVEQHDVADDFNREVHPLISVLSWRAWQLTRNHFDAEDLLQETMLYAYAGFGSFERGSNLQAWMMRIMFNRWCTAHRRARTRPKEVLVDHIEMASSALGDRRATKASAEAEALEAFTHGDSHRAMAALPAEMRAALYCTAVAGYTYAETAAILKIPVGTVMSRVFRARRRLRNDLTKAAPASRPASVVAEQMLTLGQG
jgi:RNA polymerase sigma-70 factor (ECF subfamily)